jgi:integrase
MPRLYKRGRTWWCSFYDAEKRRVRASTRCTDRVAAGRVADRLERDAADPRRAAANATTLRDALSRLLIDRRQRGRAEGTIGMYATKAGQLTRVLGGTMPLASITATAVDRFVSQRLDEGASRNTIGKELTTLRSALKIARRRGEYAGDVAAVMPVGWSLEYRPRRRVLRSAADLQELVDELAPARGAHVCFLVATAARDAEVARARRADVDLARGVVQLRGTKTELSDDAIAVVAWMRALLEHVLATCPGSRLFRPWTNIRRDLAEACERVAARRTGRPLEEVKGSAELQAAFPRVSPNDLRRTHATWLRAAGVDLGLVARQLRHVDTRMVSRVYGRLDAVSAGAALGVALGCDTGVPESHRKRGSSGLGGHASAAESVPRGGIEPPTRGFSIRAGGRARQPKRAAAPRPTLVAVTPACQPIETVVPLRKRA